MERRAKAQAELVAGGSGGGLPGYPLGAGQMAAINRWALEPLTEEQVYVRQVRLANDAVDRTWERLPREYLERFAATLPGKPLLLSHDHAETPTGLWFQAEVRPSTAGEPGEWTLAAWFYLRKTAANEELRRQIDAGVIRYASIGFRYDGMTCDLCGAAAMPMGGGGCDHRPGQVVDGQIATFTYGGDPARVEAHEGSLVYLGAQYGAQLTKAVGCSLSAVREGEPVVTDSRQPTADSPDSLVADGRAYRAALAAELARLAGIVRAEAEGELLAQALMGQEASKWLPVIDSFRARVEALLSPAPRGHPVGVTGRAAPVAHVMRPVRLG